MRKSILFFLCGLLVSTFSGVSLAQHVNTSARCGFQSDCELGDTNTNDLRFITDVEQLDLGDTAAGTLTLTAGTTATAVFQGADAAGAANTTFDTTTTGTVQLGSADVGQVILQTDNDINFINGATGNLTVGFRDYADTTDDDMAHALITVNCTTATTGAEDCDFTIGVVEGGAAADTRFNINADGGVTLGSATNNSLTVTTATSSMDLEGTTANTLTLTAATTGTAIFQGADAAGVANTTLDTTGAGAIAIGSADVTAVTIVTDGGTVTIDGSVNAIMEPAIVLTAGTLTVNRHHIATAAGDYDLPDSCDTATGNWVSLIVQDANELISLTVLAAEDEIKVGGVDAAANEEIDSSASATTGDGDSITVACLQANVWYAIAQSGVWVDGGAAD